MFILVGLQTLIFILELLTLTVKHFLSEWHICDCNFLKTLVLDYYSFIVQQIEYDCNIA